MLIRMASAMLTAANSARSEMMEVMLPAPAIKGKATGTMVAVFMDCALCLNSVTPRIISSAMKNITMDPATAKELTSIPRKLITPSPRKRKANMMPKATMVARSGWMSPAFCLMSSRKGMEPTMSMTANITIADLRSSVVSNAMLAIVQSKGVPDKDTASTTARKAWSA